MLIRSALDGFAERTKREQRMQMMMAWHTARMTSFTQQLEPLSNWLDPLDHVEEDPDVAWHRMKVWAAANGQKISEE